MRVQFTINDKEYEYLFSKATDLGYPDISSYCRDMVLNSRSYAQMWKTIVNKINNMPSKVTFALKDLVDAPPSNLGVKLYNHQDELKIRKVKKGDGRNIFEKI